MPTATSTVDELTTYCSDRKRLIDRELTNVARRMIPVGLQSPLFKGSLEYALLHGGKRLRPIFGIAVYELFKDSLDEVVPPLCAIELIHASSLMLDDLPCMDNAEYRRGQKASHAVFGDAVTILASASLSVEALNILAGVESDKTIELIRRYGQSIGGHGLIQGQLLDLASFNYVQTEEELAECYRLKTGLLFSLAAGIGVILGEGTKEEQERLEAFATSYGIAFQIRDDILDATHTKEETGKDSGKDSVNKKPTFVNILGVQGAREALGRKVGEARAHLLAVGRKSVMLELLLNQLLDV